MLGHAYCKFGVQNVAFKLKIVGVEVIRDQRDAIRILGACRDVGTFEHLAQRLINAAAVQLDKAANCLVKVDATFREVAYIDQVKRKYLINRKVSSFLVRY